MNLFKLYNNFESTIYNILDDFEFIRKGKNGKISNVPSVFDIEVSSFYNDQGEKQSTMYAWVFGINGKCIRGRFWWEFLDVVKVLKKEYQLSPNKRFVVYVHNLSYEFQFLRHYFEWEKVFAIDSRKPLYAITKDGIEFRCSYLLSGYSLAVLGENLTKYKVNKAIGDLDYNLIRHSYTPLTEREWGYILNDGLVVMAHIQEEIERLGTLAKIPLTKTGYVRDLCREKCLKGSDKHNFNRIIKKCVMTPNDYLELKRAYTGGFTHANISYVGKTLKNVSSYDFTSSYPSVMVSEKYPTGRSKRLDIHTDCVAFRNALKMYCCMFDIKFENIVATSPNENYISISRTSKSKNAIVNNGRVIEADEIVMTLTEQDFFIIEKMYTWDNIQIANFKYYKKDYLPKDIIMTILELYKDKTELKGVKDKEIEYLVSKGMINSVYGMCVTDPCKDDQIYDGEWATENADIQALIERYNSNRQRTLYYPWGVWVTAYARANLFSGILEFGSDYIYSDTDSIKVLNRDKHSEYIESYNKNITSKIYKCLDHYNIPHYLAHPKTIKGIEKPIGVWDYEGDYTRFKTLGAKRYVVEKADGDIEITIAGVSKKTGKEYLKYKYKTNNEIFKNFSDGLYFPPHYDNNGVDTNAPGKLCHTYIDIPMSGTLVDYMGNSAPYYEYSGIHMENTDYTLGLDKAFKSLLQGRKDSIII